MKKKLLRGLVLSALVSLGVYLTPTPYVLTAPGPSFSARKLVHVEGVQTYASQGRFLLMTVLAEPASLLFCLYTLFDPAAELTGRPQAQSGGDQDAWQMSLSQSVSTEVAVDYVLFKEPKRSRGLAVVTVLPEGPNAQALKPGDILMNLGTKRIHQVADLPEVLNRLPANHLLTATVARGPTTLQLPLRIWQNGPRKMLGFRFAPVLQGDGQPVQIHIDSEQVGGASGGLVFCLELIDQLTREDLTRGRVVAATGTLDRQARVGSVEGVRFKAVAARRAGAQLFLCPKANLAELDNQGGSLKILGVDSLEEALSALKSGP